jgi:hypothetical protein
VLYLTRRLVALDAGMAVWEVNSMLDRPHVEERSHMIESGAYATRMAEYLHIAQPEASLAVVALFA